MRLFSNWIRKWLGLLDRAFWAPFSLANTLFFRPKILPNTSLFRTLALSTKFLMAKWRLDSDSQALLTTLGNFGWWIHIVWNLKGFSTEVSGGLDSSSRTGQRSENTLGKWIIGASGKRTLQEGFAKHLSMRSKIRSETYLRYYINLELVSN